MVVNASSFSLAQGVDGSGVDFQRKIDRFYSCQETGFKIDYKF